MSVAVLVGCAHQVPAATVGPPDMPVPSDEPRATVTLLLELNPGPQCEEDFDLALYRNRAVELVEWTDGGTCGERRVMIRYLERQISEAQLLGEVRRHAVTVQVVAERAVE